MVEFVEYENKYQHLKLSRDQHGILLVQLHCDNDFFRMGETTHRDLTAAFRQIALDRANRVVIITGTGSDFIGPRADAPGGRTLTRQITSPTNTRSGKNLLGPISAR